MSYFTFLYNSLAKNEISVIEDITIGLSNLPYLLQAMKSNNSLLHLRLDDNSIDDKSLALLVSFLEHNKTLISLSLKKNRITDAGLKVLADRITKIHVKCIDLRHNQFTFAGTKYFVVKLHDNYSLTQVFINPLGSAPEDWLKQVIIRNVNTSKLLRYQVLYSTILLYVICKELFGMCIRLSCRRIPYSLVRFIISFIYVISSEKK